MGEKRKRRGGKGTNKEATKKRREEKQVRKGEQKGKREKEEKEISVRDIKERFKGEC